jgi:uncharacterized protein YbjT (DUF2867 family)
MRHVRGVARVRECDSLLVQMTTAWLAGGSGLVGSALLRMLLEDDDFAVVVSVGRRVLPVEHTKLVQVETDLATPADLETLPAPSVAFCCLGTTIKKAGSREAFRKVDHDAVILFAQAARKRGAQVFVHVTALGASPRSGNFYSAVKGETERDVGRVSFPSVYALRPSILDGDREESRPAEHVGLLVGRVIAPLLGKYRPTPVANVAATMIALAKVPAPGVHVVEPDKMVAV